MGDYDTFLFLAYGLLTTLFFYFIVLGSQSKYATIAASRLLVVVVSMDVFFTLTFLFFCGHVGGCAIEDYADVNLLLLTPACAIPPLALVLLLHTLYESKRAPFDHAEAESELVAGHLVEFGGRVLLFLYVCEYLHVFFVVYMVSTFVLGGPWGLSLLPLTLCWEIFISPF